MDYFKFAKFITRHSSRSGVFGDADGDYALAIFLINSQLLIKIVVIESFRSYAGTVRQ